MPSELETQVAEAKCLTCDGVGRVPNDWIENSSPTEEPCPTCTVDNTGNPCGLRWPALSRKCAYYHEVGKIDLGNGTVCNKCGRLVGELSRIPDCSEGKLLELLIEVNGRVEIVRTQTGYLVFPAAEEGDTLVNALCQALLVIK